MSSPAYNWDYQNPLAYNLITFLFLVIYLSTCSLSHQQITTLLLNNQSPFEKLFDAKSKYDSLCTFGSLCYPWLKPYTTNKLQPRSTPCVYLGFSQTHYAHQCFDPINSKFYISRDVKFLKNIFLFKLCFLTFNPISPLSLRKSAITHHHYHQIPLITLPFFLCLHLSLF